MNRKVKVCYNCNQVRLHHEGTWPCETCGEPVKSKDGTQLRWRGTREEVEAHQHIHDSHQECKICAGDPTTRIRSKS